MNGKYNGQTKSEYLKNYKRVNDMLTKAPGDSEQQTRLAQKQANAITDEHKAINRAMVAKELGQEHIFEVFFRKAYELGSVGKQEYREYQLSKLGI
jgi:thiaminase